MTECVGFNVPLDTQQVISETSLSRQSIVLVLTTKKEERQRQNRVTTDAKTDNLRHKAITEFLMLEGRQQQIYDRVM